MYIVQLRFSVVKLQSPYHDTTICYSIIGFMKIKYIPPYYCQGLTCINVLASRSGPGEEISGYLARVSSNRGLRDFRAHGEFSSKRGLRDFRAIEFGRFSSNRGRAEFRAIGDSEFFEQSRIG